VAARRLVRAAEGVTALLATQDPTLVDIADTDLRQANGTVKGNSIAWVGGHRLA
jgi:hypothetical protein